MSQEEEKEKKMRHPLAFHAEGKNESGKAKEKKQLEHWAYPFDSQALRRLVMKI